MFGFLKPKIGAALMGQLLADSMTSMMKETANEKFLAQLKGMVDGGANSSRVRPEITALTCYFVITGIVSAYQDRKMTADAYSELSKAYFQRLQDLSESIDALASGSLSYSTFGEFLNARIMTYAAIDEAYSSKLARDKMIDSFCDFACDGEGSYALRFEVLTTGALVSGATYDRLARLRLVCNS